MDHMAKKFAIKSDFKPELNLQTQRTQRKKFKCPLTSTNMTCHMCTQKCAHTYAETEVIIENAIKVKRIYRKEEKNRRNGNQ